MPRMPRQKSESGLYHIILNDDVCMEVNEQDFRLNDIDAKWFLCFVKGVYIENFE